MAGPLKPIPPTRREEIALEEIRAALDGLVFGTVTVVIQNGVVIQIERTSKHRLDYSEMDKVNEGEGI